MNPPEKFSSSLNSERHLSWLEMSAGLMVVVVAYAVFAWGVWRQPVGFAEDTGPLGVAIQNLETGTWNGNVFYIAYIAYTLVLKACGNDVIAASAQRTDFFGGRRSAGVRRIRRGTPLSSPPLGCASSVAILLLISSPRYWLPLVPITYLGLAWCAELISRSIPKFPAGIFLAVVGVLAFCRPVFLDSKLVNYEVAAMHSLRGKTKPNPTVCALWADPFCIYGFNGKAQPRSIFRGLKREDIITHQCDSLVIDRGLRNSRAWADEQTFFENFELDPVRYGFAKLAQPPNARRKFYYVPAPVPQK